MSKIKFWGGNCQSSKNSSDKYAILYIYGFVKESYIYLTPKLSFQNSALGMLFLFFIFLGQNPLIKWFQLRVSVNVCNNEEFTKICKMTIPQTIKGICKAIHGFRAASVVPSSK